MGHEIFEKSVHSRNEPMWHQLQPPCMEDMTAIEVLDKEFDGGYTLETRDIVIELNGDLVPTGDYGIVRGAYKESPEEVLGYCTERYTLLQPREVAESYDMNVNEYVETMAFLRQGKEMFISWKMPPFDVVLGDKLEPYGIVRVGFTTDTGAKLFTSIYRPVCANTINLAERQGNHIWRGTGVNQNLLRDLGYWMEHVQGRALAESEALKEFLSTLARNSIDDDGVKSVLFEAFPDSEDFSHRYPVQLREEKAQKIAQYNEGQQRIRDGIFRLWAGEGTSIQPTFWGAVCATSEYFCHYQPSKRPIAESVMFGARQNHIISVINALTKRVE